MSFALNYTTAWERFVEWYRGSWVDQAFTFLFERVFVVSFEEYEKIPLPVGAGATVRNWILSFLVAFWVAAVVMAVVKAVPGGFVRRLLALGAVDEEHAVTLAEAGYKRSGVIRRDLARGGALAKLLSRPGDGEKTVAGTAVPKPEEEVDPATGQARPSLLARLEDTEKASAPAPETEKPEEEKQAEPAATEAELGGDAPEKPDEQGAPAAPAPLNFETDRFFIPAGLRARAEQRFSGRNSGFVSALLSVVVSTFVAFLLCGVIPLLFRLANWMLGG